MKTEFNIKTVCAFAEWLDSSTWTKHEYKRNGDFETEKWYNTYNYAAMEDPLTTEELFELYLKTINES